MEQKQILSHTFNKNVVIKTTATISICIDKFTACQKEEFGFFCEGLINQESKLFHHLYIKSKLKFLLVIPSEHVNQLHKERSADLIRNVAKMVAVV